ncbi:MAG: alpha/beta hydrolase [Patescibacteria group bacterium]|jgi:pimeloyl-ACP methyl ester carboxylesterase
MAKLLEFKNQDGELLRGIVDEANSDRAVIFLHGFEGSTVRMRFKNIVDRLKDQAVSFRLDFAGAGISDGDFSKITVAKMVGELNSAIMALKSNCTNIKNVSVVAHSLGACVALKFNQENPDTLGKLILLAPGLNQQKLLRYFFVQSELKDQKIEWSNYEHYLDEAAFQNNCRLDHQMRKEHYLDSGYLSENSEMDYQQFLQTAKPENILIIHGLSDEVVPMASNDKIPSNIRLLEVRDGNHDLARPDMVDQYLDEVIEFLK